MPPHPRRAAHVALALAPVALKIAAMLWALHAGFAQVSDDDYARTVIAQSFAHAPRLDPSGTSWLPLPFWIYGGVMMALGRSLAVARGLAFVLGALSPLVVWAGLRSMQIARIPAALGAAVFALTPWSVWLGLAPVPEAWAGACAAGALFFAASSHPRGEAIAGALACVASLSRYEAWPIAALVAAVAAVRFVRGEGARAWHVAGFALAVLGPAFWLANNAITHGDALHFVARVAAYRRANGGVLSIADRIFEYPRALRHDAPEILIAGLIGAFAATTQPALRARWVLPLGGAALVFAFLIYGDLRDGAPTHHAARALLPAMAVLAGFGADALFALASHKKPVVAAALAAWLAFVIFRVRDVPGNDAASRREGQIARGRALAGAAALDVTPCAYEHFALIAAYGAPERVTIHEAERKPVTPDCPEVRSR
ncbi:MAG TPA: hypothetical protein VGH28_04680 [Polyangiaceae bacterium]|jgi:hypothetical protein